MVNNIQKQILEYHANEIKAEIKQDEQDIARLQNEIQEIRIEKTKKEQNLKEILQNTGGQEKLK